MSYGQGTFIRDHQGRAVLPSVLTPEEQQQRQREELERSRRAVHDHQQRQARLAAEREERRRAEARDRLDAYRTEVRQRWLRAGGDEAGFADAWPRLRQEFVLAQAQRDPVEELYQRMREAQS